MTKIFVHLEEKWLEKVEDEDQNHPGSAIIRGVDDQSQTDVGEILRLESLYQMLLEQNTAMLTFRKQIIYFTNDSTSIEVHCPCNLGLFW